jgi:hypothetical protein
MKVAITIHIDTEDPRYQGTMDIVKLLGPLPAHPGPATDRGDAWEPPDEGPRRSSYQDAEEDEPRDGRQLLGWASKQIPDMKGTILSFGKKHGLASKIVSWTENQVQVAYRFARQKQQQGARP